MSEFRYCPRCASALEVDGANRVHCAACGFVVWHDPKVAVGVLVRRGDEVLLVQRNHEPGYGRWSFPSGFVDRGEVVEGAAAREVLEEALVEVRIGRLLGVFSEAGNPVVFVMFEGELTAGEAAPGPEALAVGYFSRGALPPLAFAHDAAIIEAALRA